MGERGWRLECRLLLLAITAYRALVRDAGKASGARYITEIRHEAALRECTAHMFVPGPSPLSEARKKMSCTSVRTGFGLESGLGHLQGPEKLARRRDELDRENAALRALARPLDAEEK